MKTFRPQWKNANLCGTVSGSSVLPKHSCKALYKEAEEESHRKDGKTNPRVDRPDTRWRPKESRKSRGVEGGGGQISTQIQICFGVNIVWKWHPWLPRISTFWVSADHKRNCVLLRTGHLRLEMVLKSDFFYDFFFFCFLCAYFEFLAYILHPLHNSLYEKAQQMYFFDNEVSNSKAF